MIKIFKAINKAIRIILSMLTRLVLLAVYFTLFLPFGIWAYFYSDFLDGKKKSPYWITNSKIEDVANFLRRQ